MSDLTLYRRPAVEVLSLALYLGLIGEGLVFRGPACMTLVSARSCAVLHEIAPVLVVAGLIGAAVAAVRFGTLWRPLVALEAQGLRLAWRGLIPWSEIAGAEARARRWLPAFAVELTLRDRRGYLKRHRRAAAGPARLLLWLWTRPLGAALLGRFTRINVFGSGTRAQDLAAAINVRVAALDPPESNAVSTRFRGLVPRRP